MARGRPPTPTALKILRGNPGKRAINTDEPKPPRGEVKPPPWLKGRGRTAWKWIAPVLQQMGVLTTADPHALALLCDAYAEYIECRATVRKFGAVYESRVVKASTRRVDGDTELDGDKPEGLSWDDEDFDGNDWSVIIRPRPEVKMASDAWRRVQRMLTEFGLTPSSRSKVKGEPEGEADPFEEWAGANRRSS